MAMPPPPQSIRSSGWRLTLGGDRYLMRSPAFETFVRPLLEFLQRIARRIPVPPPRQTHTK